MKPLQVLVIMVDGYWVNVFTKLSHVGKKLIKSKTIFILSIIQILMVRSNKHWLDFTWMVKLPWSSTKLPRCIIPDFPKLYIKRLSFLRSNLDLFVQAFIHAYVIDHMILYIYSIIWFASMQYSCGWLVTSSW